MLLGDETDFEISGFRNRPSNEDDQPGWVTEIEGEPVVCPSSGVSFFARSNP
jgi:hypothetical protein